MNHFLYEIQNTINKKIFIGKYSGNLNYVKLNYSSNKNLKSDIKYFGHKLFSKKIILKFETKEKLLKEYNKLVTQDFKLRNDTYNDIYKMSINGQLNISKGKQKSKIQKRSQKYINFKKEIIYKGRSYFIKNYCEHGDLIISQTAFDKLYKLNNIRYCSKCVDEYISNLTLNSNEILINLCNLNKILIYAKNYEENYLKLYYPEIYKSVLIWTEKYNIKTFKEKIFFAKKSLLEYPKCLCCNEPVYFSPTHKQYTVYCKKHLNNHHTSKEQENLCLFISNLYKGNMHQNYKIHDIELDIYLPELNLGIEFNGLYWHSDIFKDKNFHYNKYSIALNNNIQLLTIWEDDWRDKQEIIKSIIKNQLKLTEQKLYARNTKIKKVNSLDSSIFLEQNHLQGKCQSLINLGLYYNDELVSLMTFGKKRMILKSLTKNKNEYELLRFCNKLNTNVVGGASKLFKYFNNEYYNTNIVSYSNLDISNGHLYEVLGFKNLGWTGLNYWWAKDKRCHRSNFMKYKLVKAGADPNKTAEQILKEQNYLKIYGCGNLKYEYKGVN